MFRLDPVAAFEELFMKSPAAKVEKTKNVSVVLFARRILLYKIRGLVRRNEFQNDNKLHRQEQECIPVGCLPSAH